MVRLEGSDVLRSSMIDSTKLELLLWEFGK
jgi:hypothetical protein